MNEPASGQHMLPSALRRLDEASVQQVERRVLSEPRLIGQEGVEIKIGERMHHDGLGSRRECEPCAHDNAALTHPGQHHVK